MQTYRKIDRQTDVLMECLPWCWIVVCDWVCKEEKVGCREEKKRFRKVIIFISSIFFCWEDAWDAFLKHVSLTYIHTTRMEKRVNTKHKMMSSKTSTKKFFNIHSFIYFIGGFTQFGLVFHLICRALGLWLSVYTMFISIHQPCIQIYSHTLDSKVAILHIHFKLQSSC